jgi:hypothetical protein
MVSPQTHNFGILTGSSSVQNEFDEFNFCFILWSFTLIHAINLSARFLFKIEGASEIYVNETMNNAATGAKISHDLS